MDSLITFLKVVPDFIWGAIFSLGGVIIYGRMSQKQRSIMVRLKRLMVSGKPWEGQDKDVGLRDMLTFASTRIFVIRLGNLTSVTPIYEASMNYMIEAEHVWDWHFFMETPVRQHVRPWLKVFFCQNEDGRLIEPPIVNEDNSTTQVGVVRWEHFFKDTDVRRLFKDLGLGKDQDLQFDDLTIYGRIKNTERYPEFRELVTAHLDNIEVEQIYIYRTKSEPAFRRIVIEQQEFGQRLIKMIARLYDTERYVYIDDPNDISDADRDKAAKLAKQILAEN